MNKYFSVIAFTFILIFLINFTQAEVQSLPPVKQASCMQIIQTCSNCTYINVTKVRYPNETEIYPNANMTKGSNFNYNFTFCGTDTLGNYVTTTCGDVDGANPPVCVDYDFSVTATGQDFTGAKSAIYIAILGISFILFILALAVGLSLPSKNKTDEVTGYIFAIENLKYLKIFCFAFSYLILIGIFYIGYVLSYAFLDMPFISDLLRAVFYIMTVLLIPGFIFFVYILIANWIRDFDLKDKIDRGYRIKDE